jgi:poly(hydroxyalkanoate) granule-associated protein
MSKKNQKPAADESALKAMANKIMESGQQIWQAGLGAFAKAQEEGSKLYDALVKEGSNLEKITTKYTSSKVEEVRDAVESTVNQVKQKASDNWDKLEKVFEERVGRALSALGIPSREELNELSKRVDELAKAVKGGKSAEKPVAKTVVNTAQKAAKVVSKAAKANVAKASKSVKRGMAAVSKAVAKSKKK